jgi:tetratricopeptide (TPR) repeat protein
MKQIITYLLLIITIQLNAASITEEEQQQYIDSAKIYYQNKQYDKAVETYRKILANGYESGMLYYNMANAYYKMNKINDAILNYERAKKLLPNNKDTEFNLAIANQQITDKIEQVPEFFIRTWLKNLRGIFSTNTWAIISMVSFVIFLTLTFVFFFTTSYQTKRASFWGAITLIILSVNSFIFSYQTKQDLINRNAGIIFEPVINVKASPGENGTDIFVIHEGTKVEITQESGDWVEIKLANGNKGWIKRDLIEII